MTFSVDLTTASAGEWFLDGQALKASSVYAIHCDGTRHTLTIRLVPVSLHGAELKFVANGIESSIRMEVRGRGTPSHDPGAPLSPISSRSGGGMGSLGSQGSEDLSLLLGQAGCWMKWGQVVGCARSPGVSGRGAKVSPMAPSFNSLSVCPPSLPLLPSSLLVDSFYAISCPVSAFLASLTPLHHIWLFPLCSLCLVPLPPSPTPPFSTCL